MAITDKQLATQALQGLLQAREREVFAAIFLDNQHQVLAYEELFLGTPARSQRRPLTEQLRTS